jgi:hypothetical protein
MSIIRMDLTAADVEEAISAWLEKRYGGTWKVGLAPRTTANPVARATKVIGGEKKPGEIAKPRALSMVCPECGKPL